MFKDEEAAERDGLQAENDRLRAEKDRWASAAAQYYQDKEKLSEDLQAAQVKGDMLKHALQALLEVCNNILSIEDGGKNYIADLATCKREIVLPALVGQKCALPGPAGLFCEREAGHDGNHMGDLSKAYPKQKKCRCPNYISMTDGKCNACGLEVP